MKFEIDILSRNYIESKRVLTEYEENIISVSSNRLSFHRRIVHHIEYVVSSMDEKERIIIENEVLKGKRGKWYEEMMSAPTYYRYQQNAYANFLRCL